MRTTFAALRSKSYRNWAIAGFVSVVGTWMQVLGVNWYVLRETGSTTSMGFAILLQAVPTIVLSVWGGALADRVPARALLIASQLVHAGLAAGLAALAWSDSANLPAVYVISLLSGAVSAIEGPVMGRYGSTLVDRATLANALALGSLANSAGRILGMSAGAVVVATTGPAPLFAINSASFGAVVLALLAAKPIAPVDGDPTGTTSVAPAARSTPADAGVRAGLAYLRRQPVILTALALAFVLGSLGRNYQVTMAAMSDGPLRGGASGYGLLSTVFAVGTVVGSLAAARRSDLSYHTLVGAGFLASVLQLLAGFAPGTESFAALILPIAAGAVLIDTTMNTRAQLDTDGAMRGRVLAALAVTGSVASAVGAPLLGWLSEHVGPRQTLVLAGGVGVAASLAAGATLIRQHGHTVRGAELRLAVREAVGWPARLPTPTAERVPRRPQPADQVLSRTCPAGHAPAPVGARATRTGLPARECEACAPRCDRPRRRSVAATTRRAVEAGSPRRWTRPLPSARRPPA